MVERKNKIVAGLVKGVRTLLKTWNVELVEGRGVLGDPKTVRVVKPDGTDTTVRADAVILGTGMWYPSRESPRRPVRSCRSRRASLPGRSSDPPGRRVLRPARRSRSSGECGRPSPTRPRSCSCARPCGQDRRRGTRNRDPKLARLLNLLTEFRAGQQRLAGNAAPIQAQAAHSRALDEGDLRAELGRANRGHVAAGPGSDDGDACV